jgi:four helix bundle protein
MARNHTKLKVFHTAHQLALEVYSLTESLPPDERFGVRAQLRRAAVSVPTNIVEGCVRSSVRDYGRFLDMALGSAAEVRYLLELSGDLRLLQGPELSQCKESSDHVARALQKLQRAVVQLPA